MSTPEPEPLVLPDAAAWRNWLESRHADTDGVWVTLAKKGTTEPTSLTYEQALEEALCYGWIDGKMRGGDATFLQSFTPRRAKSRWSRRNVERVQRLTEQGRMRPAGMAEVERAKADGRWDEAYAGPATVQVHPDLAAALADNPAARAMFDVLTSQNRFAILYQVDEAKRAETRARRIEKFVTMLARGETPYPQRRRPDATGR